MRGPDTNSEPNINTEYLLGGHAVSKHAFEVVRELQEQLSNMQAQVARVELDRDEVREDRDSLYQAWENAFGQVAFGEVVARIEACEKERANLQDLVTSVPQIMRKLAATEELCQKYREALEDVREKFHGKSLEWIEWRINNLHTTPQAARNNAIADELERMAEGFQSNHPDDETKYVQYYGSHVIGVLRNRAKELREMK